MLTIPHGGEQINHVAATYDLLTGGEQTGMFELRLSLLAADGPFWMSISILHLARPTLTECVEAAAAEARSHGAQTTRPTCGETSWPAWH